MDSTIIIVNSIVSLHYSHSANGMDYFGIHRVSQGFDRKLMDVVEGATDAQVVQEFQVRQTVPVLELQTV